MNKVYLLFEEGEKSLKKEEYITFYEKYNFKNEIVYITALGNFTKVYAELSDKEFLTLQINAQIIKRSNDEYWFEPPKKISVLDFGYIKQSFEQFGEYLDCIRQK